MKASTMASVLLLACSLPWLAGCSGPEIQARISGNVAQMPAGKTAVLKVTARPLGKPKSADVLWGVVQAPNAPKTFADLLAHFAGEAGGLDVIPPTEVAETLEKAGLEPTLNPSPEQLDTFAEALECASYLTAHVEMWRSRYLLTGSTATIRFVVSCHVPTAEEPLWSVSVEQTRRGVGYRKVAISALRDTFESIAERAAAGPK